MKTDEERLVAACRHNDQRACRELYDRLAPSMLGLCTRYVRDRDAAQDVLHDGFIKVFSNLHRLHSADSLKAWVTTIMVHTAINTLRNLHPTTSLDNIDAETLPDPSPDYTDVDTEQLLLAMQQLSDMQRIVLNMYEIEGYSSEEIGKQLGIKATSVRSIAFRAKQLLAYKLGHYHTTTL